MSCLCKHTLAAKLADALENQGLLETKIIEDNDFAPLLLSAKSHLQKYDQKIVQSNKNSIPTSSTSGFL